MKQTKNYLLENTHKIPIDFNAKLFFWCIIYSIYLNQTIYCLKIKYLKRQWHNTRVGLKQKLFSTTLKNSKRIIRNFSNKFRSVSK